MTIAAAPRLQTARGLNTIFSPRSVAVIGASEAAGSVGRAIMENLLKAPFTGPVYPVNPKRSEILGRRTYPSIADVPGPVDLAVVAVPAAAVLDVVESCGRKGVSGLVLVSAGFRETGPQGAELEARLLEIVRRHGMRMVGPNCIGVLNMDPAIRLNATFAPSVAKPGSIAMMTQSGALGVALLRRASDLGLGVSQFCSMGNKSDVSGNDLLLLWESDPQVSQILMYLESFGNPRNFVSIARRVSRTKPIIAVKAGRSSAGARAAQSHTGALAQSDRFVDALFDQCGVLRVNTVEELFDYSLATTLQPLPVGPRVAIVTNSGGPAIMAVDALESAGLALAELSADTKARCEPFLSPTAAFGNPSDTLAGVDAASFGSILDAVLGDSHVDAVIVVCTPVLGDRGEMADAVAAASKAHPGVPTLAVFFGEHVGSATMRRLVDQGVPAYPFPENAVRSLGAMRRIREFQTRPEGEHPTFATDKDEAQRILSRATRAGHEWMRPHEALALLEAYGIRTPRHAYASTSAEAEAAAVWVEYPLVLKAEARGLIHKSDVGGVRLGIVDADHLRKEFDAMKARVDAAGYPFRGALIMHEEPAGTEMLVGATQDPNFGPLMAVGLGGVFAETLKDVAFHLAPLTDDDADRMLRSLRALPILEGARGRPPLDLDALRRVLIKLSRLAADFPQISELEMNPFLLYKSGAGGMAVDARVRLDTGNAEKRP